MKKFVMVLAVVLIVSGMVFAQAPTLDASYEYGDRILQLKSNPFPSFNAVQTQSAEFRSSNGRFSSDVDNYISAFAYNPTIGTFMFMGGLANLTTAQRLGISLGYGKTLDNGGYVGVYYGGSILKGPANAATGQETTAGASGSGVEDADEKIDTSSTATWENNLALVYATGGNGFRLDFIADNVTDTYADHDGKLTKSGSSGGNLALAFTWGSKNLGTITPWVQAGFKFPSVEQSGDGDGKTATKISGATANLILNVQFGLAPGNTKLHYHQLIIGGIIPTSFDGDKEEIVNLTGYSNGTKTDPYTEGGTLGFRYQGVYQQDVVFGPVTVKVRPILNADFISINTNSTSDAGKDIELPSENYFRLNAQMVVGARYVYDKIGLFTHVHLQFFEWRTLGYLGGDSDHKSNNTEWTVTGIGNPTTIGTIGGANPTAGNTKWTGNLGIGMTFTPITGLVFGVAATATPTFYPTINVKEMTITTNKSSEVGISGLGATLSIVASYKY